jgi:hypothetical protein
MNGKTAIAGGVGVALGITLLAVSARLSAQGQATGSGTQREVVVRPRTVEYKVVYAERSDNDTAKAESQMSRHFNALSAQGWEYAGPVVERSKSPGFHGYEGVAGVFVLFKRVTVK